MSSSILLSLCAGCTMQPLPRKGEPLAFLDIPRFTAEELELRGLVIPVELVRGRPAQELERFRDEADRAHCPCLTLMQDAPIDFSLDQETVTKALFALLRAAKLLGCGEVAVRPALTPATTDAAVSVLKSVLHSVHAQDLNVLLRPMLEPVGDAAYLVETIKKIGGFHIGAMPSFSHASASGEGLEALKKAAPYSGAVEVSIAGFDKDGEHQRWDLSGYVEGLIAYGYTNKFAINWEGKTNWVAGVEKAREKLWQLMGREDPVA